MEEAEKRRERLKALRMEAVQAEHSSSQDASEVPGYLANPLLNPPASPSPAENSPAVSRFDFYTDPMSAFSGNKKRSRDLSQNKQACFLPSFSNGVSPGQLPSSYSGPRNPNMSPVPTLQFQLNPGLDARLNETPVPKPMSGPWRSPVEMASPFSVHRGTPAAVSSFWNQSGGGNPSYGFPPNSRGSLPSPGYGHGGSQSSNLGSGSSHSFYNNPNPHSGWSDGKGWGAASARDQPELFDHKSMVEDQSGGSTPSYGFPPNKRGSLPSPGYGRGGSQSLNSGSGSYHRIYNSPNPHSGRSKGKGRGAASAREQPDLFYHKSMVEDPWKFLKPTVGRLVAVTRNSEASDPRRSWLPKSVSVEKAKVSDGAFEFSSQSSLADCLALSFEEAANDVPNACEVGLISDGMMDA